jgi:predicted methyltransferase
MPPAASAVPTAPAAAAPGAPPAAQVPKESFGLYTAEHPTVYTATTATGTVIALGVAPNGRPTITLDGGQLWELDNADPLLNKGDTVTIKRATFGSFLLTTSTGRSHRVHRLQ